MVPHSESFVDCVRRGFQAYDESVKHFPCVCRFFTHIVQKVKAKKGYRGYNEQNVEL